MLEGQLLPIVEENEAARSGRPLLELRGSGAEYVIEAQTRSSLIDPLLRALGWNLADPRSMLVEDGLNARQDGAGTRRFLDYHGRAVLSELRRTLLIVEAKRLSASLPGRPGSDPTHMFLDALARVRAGSLPAEDFPAAWSVWLDTLRDYSERSRLRHGHLPLRVAISNGIWWVVFRNPECLMPEGRIRDGDVAVYTDLDQVRADARGFGDMLGYRELSGELPPQHPAALASLAPEHGTADLAVGIVVSKRAFGEVEPVMALRVVATMPTSMGASVTFQKDFGTNFVQLHQDQDLLDGAHRLLSSRLDDLKRELERSAANVRWLTCIELEAHPARAKLCRPVVDDHLVSTGDRPSILSDDAHFDTCPYHDWTACRREGSGAGTAPIMAPSVDPPAFFASGSNYHCGHEAVRTGKAGRCLLGEIDGYLCCRRCVFFNRCWGDEPAALPCLSGGPETER